MKKLILQKVSIFTVVLILSFIITSAIADATTTQNQNERFTQYIIDGYTTPNLDTEQSYSSLINRYNKSKTQHILAFLHTETLSTDSNIRYLNHFIVANLGTKNVVIKNKDIMSDRIITSKIDFPINQTLPQREIKWISNQICSMNKASNGLLNPAKLLQDCKSFSQSTDDIIIQPGKFLLKVYLNEAKITPSSTATPFNQNIKIETNDLLTTKANIKIKGIGTPLGLSSIVSIGNTYSPFEDMNDRWSRSSNVQYRNQNAQYSTSNVMPPLVLLSSIIWTNK